MSTKIFRPKTFDKAIINEEGKFVQTELIEENKNYNIDVRIFAIWDIDQELIIIPASGCLDKKKVFTTFHQFDEEQIREDLGLDTISSLELIDVIITPYGNNSVENIMKEAGYVSNQNIGDILCLDHKNDNDRHLKKHIKIWKAQNNFKKEKEIRFNIIKETDKEDRMDPHPLFMTEEEIALSQGEVLRTHTKGLSNDELIYPRIKGKIIRWGFPDFITLDIPEDTFVDLNWCNKPFDKKKIPVVAYGWPTDPGFGGEDRWRHEYNYLVYEGPYQPGKYKFDQIDPAEREIELYDAVRKTFHFFNKKVISKGNIYIFLDNSEIIRSIILAASIEWGMSGGRVVDQNSGKTIALVRGGWAHENRNVAFPLCHPYVKKYLKMKYGYKK